MQITISPETEKAINAAVASGCYRDAEHYINEALRYYYELKIELLDEALAIGYEQLAKGDVVQYDRIQIAQKAKRREIDNSNK